MPLYKVRVIRTVNLPLFGKEKEERVVEIQSESEEEALCKAIGRFTPPCEIEQINDRCMLTYWFDKDNNLKVAIFKLLPPQ